MLIIADENIPFVIELFGSLGKLVIISGRKITQSVLKKADVLIVRSITKVGKELLEKTPVKFVGTATIGTDHINLDYLKEKGISFASAGGSNANSVAEYVIAGLLFIAKKTKFVLKDKSIGIIGFGNVGSKVCAKVKALGMKVLLNDPPLKRASGDKKYLPLKDIINADVITLHVPLNYSGKDATFHMIDKNFLKFLKRTTFLINTSRGPVVDSIVLKDALKNKKLAGTILDVWENEPNIDIELLKLIDIGTSHIAGYSFDGKVNGAYMIYTSLCKFLGKEPELNLNSILAKNEKPQIEIDNKNKNQQSILEELVFKMYDILEDDRNMRKMIEFSDKKRGPYFDQLRKEYRKRREFSNIKVKLTLPDKKLEEIITRLGFYIV